MQYASFWRRLSAYVVDFVLLAPILYVANYWAGASQAYYPVFLLLGLVLVLIAHVVMVWRFGGSPGKLLLRVRIVSLNGGKVSAPMAAARYSVEFALHVAASVASWIGAATLSEATYQSMSLPDRAQAIEAAAPDWYGIVALAGALWAWSEFAVMHTNARRRAFQDFIAGTVVVRSASGVET